MKVITSLVAAATGVAAMHTSKQPFDMTANGDKSCFIPGKASEYRGMQDSSKSGRKCQKWAEVTPHAGAKSTNDVAGTDKGLGNHGYCRAPTADFDTPWCYTVDPTVEKEACEIPECKASGPFARNFHEEAADTATHVGATDCQCAKQLYGATTTTKDTSVPGASLVQDSGCPCGETVDVKHAKQAIRRRTAQGQTLRGSL